MFNHIDMAVVQVELMKVVVGEEEKQVLETLLLQLVVDALA